MLCMVWLSHFYLPSSSFMHNHMQPLSFPLHCPLLSYIFLSHCAMKHCLVCGRIPTYLNPTITLVVANFDLLIQPWNLLDISKSLCHFWVCTSCLITVHSLSKCLLSGVIVEVPQLLVLKEALQEPLSSKTFESMLVPTQVNHNKRSKFSLPELSPL